MAAYTSDPTGEIKGGAALPTAIWGMSVGTNGHARWVPTWVDKKNPAFGNQRTNSTDIEPPLNAKKTAIVRRNAGQSPKSNDHRPKTAVNSAQAIACALYMAYNHLPGI